MDVSQLIFLPPTFTGTVGSVFELAVRFHTDHSLSIFAWCNQKIGSRAAVSGLSIQPFVVSPPTSTWMALCGTFSTDFCPKNCPSWLSPVAGPPKPRSPTVVSVLGEKKVSDRQWDRSTSCGGITESVPVTMPGARNIPIP